MYVASINLDPTEGKKFIIHVKQPKKKKKKKKRKKEKENKKHRYIGYSEIFRE